MKTMLLDIQWKHDADGWLEAAGFTEEESSKAGADVVGLLKSEETISLAFQRIVEKWDGKDLLLRMLYMGRMLTMKERMLSELKSALSGSE